MNLIQFLLIIAFVAVATTTFRFLPGEKSLALKRVLALLFVIAAIGAILFPDVVTLLAHTFGVGRGTDLLLYFFIIVFLLFAASVIRAKARSDARVTHLARQVALLEARLRREHNELHNDEAPGENPEA